ncbi:MAG: YaiI/YqxD family protein [Pseudomonadota bacterium]
MIYVDADACPVKAEIEQVATRMQVPVIMVCNGGLRPSANPLVRMVFVDQDADAADKWITDQAGAQDIVITSDIPLAARVIENGARVIKHDGSLLTDRNIGQILATRDLMQDVRAADPFHKGGGKPFAKADRSRFLNALDRVLRG